MLSWGFLGTFSGLHVRLKDQVRSIGPQIGANRLRADQDSRDCILKESRPFETGQNESC